MQIGVRTSCRCREMVLAFLSDNKSIHQHGLPLEGIYIYIICLDAVETIINLGKVNTIPCMHCCFSLGQHVHEQAGCIDSIPKR